jgi:hypothetical protein
MVLDIIGKMKEIYFWDDELYDNQEIEESDKGRIPQIPGCD